MTMKRSTFLRTLGALGLAPFLPRGLEGVEPAPPVVKPVPLPPLTKIRTPGVVGAVPAKRMWVTINDERVNHVTSFDVYAEPEPEHYFLDESLPPLRSFRCQDVTMEFIAEGEHELLKLLDGPPEVDVCVGGIGPVKYSFKADVRSLTVDCPADDVPRGRLSMAVLGPVGRTV